MHRALTTIEILIVFVTICVVAVAIVPRFASATEASRVSEIEIQISTIRSAVDAYQEKYGHAPDLSIGWEALAEFGLREDSLMHPRTGTSTVVVGPAPRVPAHPGDPAWYFSNGEVYAAGFNESWRTSTTESKERPWIEW